MVLPKLKLQTVAKSQKPNSTEIKSVKSVYMQPKTKHAKSAHHLTTNRPTSRIKTTNLIVTKNSDIFEPKRYAAADLVNKQDITVGSYTPTIKYG